MRAGQRKITKVAIIGDRFMTPATFDAAIRGCCGGFVDVAAMHSACRRSKPKRSRIGGFLREQ
jgi:hypothetical protein